MQSALIRLAIVGALSVAYSATLGLNRSNEQPQEPQQQQQQQQSQPQVQKDAGSMHVHYLEVVTPNVKETCEALAKAHGVSFSDPIPAFGNARTAKLKSGGRIGVRAPMRETETPVVRPYLLVEDLDKAVEAAAAAGAEIAIPRMELPGEGAIAIYILGGIEHGFWQK